ncbi:MAG TPA: apolipoprotein N-acyltransferase [bacterium]|nr:apolipoprotein N-acyltransferase [bacterium]
MAENGSDRPAASPDAPFGAWQAFALAGLGGALAILSFPGYDLWPLGFVAMVPLLAAIDGQTTRRALALGCFAGFVANAAGFYWLIVTVRDFGELPVWIAVIAYLLLSAANGLGWGVWAWTNRTARVDATGMVPWWLPPFSFVAVEFAWWSVFPAYFGAGLWKVPVLSQGADVTSILGCSFLFVFSGVALYELVRFARGRESHWRVAVPAFAAFLAVWTLYGWIRLSQIDGVIAAAPKLTIGAVQSNIGAFTKRKASQGAYAAAQEELTTYQSMSRELEAKGVDLIVWPETAYPFRMPLGIRNARQATGGLSTPSVIGAVTDQPKGAMHNTAMLLDRAGEIRGESHKIFMVPFGEYLPLGDRFPKLYELIPAISHLQPGDKPYPLVLEDNGHTIRFGSLICYEDILPGYTRNVVRATDPDMLLNLTHDSWYGDSIEPEIHMALASFRAIEHRRALLRSTNTGLSVFIDPAGRVLVRSGQWTRENVVGTLPLVHDVSTIYRALGDWFGWLALAITVAVAGPRWKKRRDAARP